MAFSLSTKTPLPHIALEDFVAGHQLSMALYQQAQQFERNTLEGNDHATTAELVGAAIDREVLKLQSFFDHFGLFADCTSAPRRGIGASTDRKSPAAGHALSIGARSDPHEYAPKYEWTMGKRK